jgi:hypothetical protein
MRIERYSFGRITIQGKTYTSDVIIYPERVEPSWWRKEGHCLHIEDLKDALQSPVAAMVIGTGLLGRMRVSDNVLSHIKSTGMEVYVEKTPEAVQVYNEISAQMKAVACLHLTC